MNHKKHAPHNTKNIGIAVYVHVLDDRKQKTNDNQTVIIFRLFSAFLALPMIFFVRFSAISQCSKGRKIECCATETPKFLHRFGLEIEFKFKPSTVFRFQPWISIACTKMLDKKKSKHVKNFRCKHLKKIDRCYQFWFWFYGFKFELIRQERK